MKRTWLYNQFRKEVLTWKNKIVGYLSAIKNREK